MGSLLLNYLFGLGGLTTYGSYIAVSHCAPPFMSILMTFAADSPHAGPKVLRCWKNLYFLTTGIDLISLSLAGYYGIYKYSKIDQQLVGRKNFIGTEYRFLRASGWLMPISYGLLMLLHVCSMRAKRNMYIGPDRLYKD